MDRDSKLIFEAYTLNGLAAGKTLEDIADKHKADIEALQAQLDKGIKVEHEHTGNAETAKKIAMDHLFEDPKYYDKLAKAEDAEDVVANPEVKEGDEKRIYPIAEMYMDVLRNEIEKVNKRGAKYGLPPVEIKVVKEYMKTIQSSNQLEGPKKYKFFDVEVVTPRPVFDGWEFIARIDHEPGGNIIVKSPRSSFQGDLSAEFGKMAPKCDHCKTTRDRNNTFVIKKEGTNELKVVGRSCLQDYTGTRNPEKFVKYADWLSFMIGKTMELSGMSEEGNFGGGGGQHSKYTPILSALASIIGLIEHLGYTSQSSVNKARETNPAFADTLTTTATYYNQLIDGADALWRTKQNISSKMEQAIAAFDAVRENYDSYVPKAKELLEWARINLPKILDDERAKNGPMIDYYNNLLTILNDYFEKGEEGHMSLKHIPFLASLVPMQKRAIEGARKREDKQKEAASSEFQGEVGGVIKDIPVTILNTRVFDTQFGTTTLYNMKDDKGNVYVWFSSGNTQEEPNQKAIITRAKVKDHKTYKAPNGVETKQTVLKNVKLT